MPRFDTEAAAGWFCDDECERNAGFNIYCAEADRNRTEGLPKIEIFT